MESAKEEALPRHFKRRHPSQSKETKLPKPWPFYRKKKDRPFIFPTGFGFTFGSLATVQLIMAIASQNNLIYLFVFFEISIALASMFFTNLNIQRVRLAGLHAQDCFAQEENPVEITIAENLQHPSYQLAVRWRSQKESRPLQATTNQVQLFWIPKERGLQTIPQIVIESSFPFGLLRAWKIESPEQQLLVFPHRQGDNAYPPASLGNQSVREQGIFHDLKPFQKGDSPRRIDWRASQRAQQLLIRRFEEESHTHIDFHWQQTAHLKDFEKRISQLALWIDRAEREGADYSLEIGKWKSGSGRGHPHWTLCLEKLAQLTPEDCK